MRKLEKTLPSYQRSAEAYEKLAADHLIGQLDAETKRREAIERAQDLESQREMQAGLKASVFASDQHLAQLKSTYTSDLHAARVDALTKIIQLEEQVAKLLFHQANLELRAPQAGVVKELATTTVGAVVQSGTVLLSLVPLGEPLLAEVSIQNEDIGFVRKGQPVRVKLSTYPFQKYGTLDGVVKTVIADSSRRDDASRASKASEQGEARGSELPFKAIVELSKQNLQTGDVSLALAAGMQLQAEILEGKRTVLEYLLSPVRRVSSEAAMER